MSATIDKTDNFEYYSKDIRNMIELKYLCDYQIHVPIFNDDPTNKNICEHLLKNYRNIIIYCNSQKEGKLINKLMNKLQLNSSNSLGILQNGEKIWIKRLDEVKQYIDTNNKRPYESDKNKQIKSLCYWISTQKKEL